MSSTVRHVIPVGLTDGVKRQFDALMRIHARALTNFRDFLSMRGCVEVTESALIEVAGSCRISLSSRHFSFGAPEHSCQGQLDVLATRLRRSYFTVNSGVQNPKDETNGNKREQLSSFTSIEGITPFDGVHPEAAFSRMQSTIEECIKFATRDLIEDYHAELFTLGSDLNYLCRILRGPFIKISYDEALSLLNDRWTDEYQPGAEIGRREERELLSYFCNMPVFVSYSPAVAQHFSMKRKTARAHVYGTSLILPKLGLSARAYLLEEKIDRMKLSLQEQAKLAPDSTTPDEDEAARQYMKLFDGSDPGARGGFALSFERFMGFLMGSRLF